MEFLCDFNGILMVFFWVFVLDFYGIFIVFFGGILMGLRWFHGIFSELLGTRWHMWLPS